MFMDSNGSLWVLIVSFASLWIQEGLLVFRGPYSSIWILMGLYGSLCIFMGSMCFYRFLASLSELVGLNRSLCVLMDPYWSVEILRGPMDSNGCL